MVTQSTNRDSDKNSNIMAENTGPSEALIQLISPDGYYTYLGIPKPSPNEIAAAAGNVGSSFIPKDKQEQSAGSGVDEDLVKKNYRKLSLKHHPDKRGGDAETFRVLNRAQKVLMNPKLRQQYDILGLDLDDDEEERDNLHSGSGDGDDHEGKDEESTTTQGIVHDIASQVMAGIMHLGVRTVMMCMVSVLVVRYRLLLFPAFLFMAFVAYQLLAAARLPDNHPQRGSFYNIASPIFISLGLLCMYWGRSDVTSDDGTASSKWTWLFWIGETLVIAVFMWNSMAGTFPGGPIVFGAIGAASGLFALWFRGKFWNYFIIIAFELLLILFVVMAFPVMEMVLETILNEKLKKVGDKVRAHQKQLEAYYANKELQKES